MSTDEKAEQAQTYVLNETAFTKSKTLEELAEIAGGQIGDSSDAKTNRPENVDGKGNPPTSAKSDSTSTRIVSRTFTCDGAFFYWWAVGEDPSLVTVTSAVFGSINGFARANLETFAMTLARDLMRHPSPPASSLEKPGRFSQK